MAESAKKPLFFGTKSRQAQREAAREAEEERRVLLEELRKTREDLRMAEIGFNNARESELIEASVYEINSLQARYAYLLRRVREDGMEQREVFKTPR